MTARGRVSRLSIFGSILRKDIMLFSRDWVFLALTIVSVTMFVTLYYVLPDDVAPGFSLGMHAPGMEEVLRTAAEIEESDEDDIPLVFYGSGEELLASVESGDVDVGIDFPAPLVEQIRAGDEVDVTVYAKPSLPAEYSNAVSTMVREMAYAVAGYELPISEPAEDSVILGRDIGPIPIREKLKPLYAFMVLIMEALALGMLISSEVQHRTMTALLSTPARLSDVLLSKQFLGTTIAFSEAVLVLILIRGLGPRPGIVIVALAMGAILVSGLAMICGSAGKDLIGNLMLGILVLVPLAIPAFAVLFPGTVATWITIVPSYGLVRAMVDTQIGGGWRDALPHLATLTAWAAATAIAGWLVLKRRVEVI